MQHPLAKALGELRQRKFTNANELEECLKWAQLETEKSWESGEFEKLMGDAAKIRTCEHQGCNHSRYPASRFCMYHVTGNDTFAAKLRRLIAESDK